MIIKHEKSIIVIVFVIAMIISSVGSISVGSVGNSGDETIGGSVTFVRTRAQAVTYNTYGFASNNYFNDSDNIVVTNTTGDESFPTMVVSGYNCLVAYEFKSGNSTQVYLRNSENYGQSWSSSYVSLGSSYNTFSPSLCIRPFTKSAYGSAVSDHNNSAVLYDIEMPSIDYLSVINAFSLDWSAFGFYNFSKPDIVYYSDASYPNVPFVVAVIGSTTYSGGPSKDTPMFFYRSPDDPTSSTIAWDAGIQNCSNISMSFDNVNKIFYGVCEIKNETNTNIFLFYDNPITWSSNSSIKYRILSWNENLTHPQIFFTENQIYIVAETETSGIIIYSSAGGNIWSLHDVTGGLLPPDATPKNPAVFADQIKVYCVFTESGNISITNSSDNGNTWSNLTQLNNQNGSVVEQYRFSDIPDANHVVWTDNREGNNDIYSVIEAAPEIDLMLLPDSVMITKGEYIKIPTKNWITYTVRNNGNAYIEDVTVEIKYTSKNKSKVTNYPGYILYLEGNGAEKTFYRPLFRMTVNEFIPALIAYAGITSITVIVDPYNVYNDLNPSDNSITIGVTYAEIFPNLSFLEKIFT